MKTEIAAADGSERHQEPPTGPAGTPAYHPCDSEAPGPPEAADDPMPVFVIKAKDGLAPRAVNAYLDLCEDGGLGAQAAQVALALDEIVEWRCRHPDLVKTPDHKHVPAVPAQAVARHGDHWRHHVPIQDSTERWRCEADGAFWPCEAGAGLPRWAWRAGGAPPDRHQGHDGAER
jgi:hypothetical protein